MFMLGLRCLSLSCDKFILPARYEPVDLRMSASVCSWHPSDTLSDRGIQNVLCGIHVGLSHSDSSSQHQHRPPPPITHPPYEEAPMLLPCLITWVRCLGVSLCRPVVLSASIMPLSGRLATAAHSLFLFVCLSVCVCVCACQRGLLMQRIHFLYRWILFT